MYIGTRQEGIICFAPNGIYKRSFSPDLQTTEQNNETNALYYYNDTLWFSLGTNSLNMLDLKSNRSASPQAAGRRAPHPPRR